MTPEELAELAAKVRALSPPQRLILAAGLLEARKPKLALTVVRMVESELAAVLLVSR